MNGAMETGRIESILQNMNAYNPAAAEQMREHLTDLEAERVRFIKANAEVANLNADLQIKLEKMERALRMLEWQPVHDPDTHELLGQLCLWCNRKPHAPNCPRQEALAAIQDN